MAKEQAPAKKAWRLIFVEGLLDNYLGGEEGWTFRKYFPGSHEFKKGQIIEGHFRDGLMLLLEVMEDTRIKPFTDITEEECVAWGNCSHAKMLEQMHVYYPDLKTSELAALNLTRLARIDNRPIAGFLPKGC